jgi:hypothetical protein
MTPATVRRTGPHRDAELGGGSRVGVPGREQFEQLTLPLLLFRQRGGSTASAGRCQWGAVVSLAQDAADASARAALSMLSSTQLRNIRRGMAALCPSLVSEYSTCSGTAG